MYLNKISEGEKGENDGEGIQRKDVWEFSRTD